MKHIPNDCQVIDDLSYRRTLYHFEAYRQRNYTFKGQYGVYFYFKELQSTQILKQHQIEENSLLNSFQTIVSTLNTPFTDTHYISL